MTLTNVSVRQHHAEDAERRVHFVTRSTRFRRTLVQPDARADQQIHLRSGRRRRCSVGIEWRLVRRVHARRVDPVEQRIDVKIAVDVIGSVEIRRVDRSFVITRFDRIRIQITELSKLVRSARPRPRLRPSHLM